MSTSDDKEQKSKPTKLPEQKLGDTPVPPWEMPTPEEKQQAKPIRRALKEAVAKVDSPEKADEVVKDLEAAASGQTMDDVKKAESPAPDSAAAAQQVQAAAKTAPEEKKAENVLETTARVIAASDKHQREVVSEAVQEVLNPQQQGAPAVANEQERQYLRDAVLKRLKPIDALDANLFLFVNHLPHTRLLNTIFYSLTVAFNGAAFWYLTLLIAAVRNRRKTGEYIREVAVPLTVATALVEYPIKSYFRRRRPFIKIIQAIVIGKKPGTWSFPSGHSAGAFAGAWLLNRKFPRRWGLRYFLAGMVAFSRTYLGDHYPGDVASGSLLGLLLAMFFQRFFNPRKAGSK